MFEFGFGDSYAVAEVAMQKLGSLVSKVEFFKPTYPPRDGYNTLNSNVHSLITRLTRLEYKHVLITHGATGAINLLLRDMATDFPDGVYTDDLYFMFYPQMIERASLRMVGRKEFVSNNKVMQLMAVPSNPKGSLVPNEETCNRTIWDACYFSPVYMSTKLIDVYVPDHKVMVGSLGKLFGLNGLRLGWIATDDTAMYERLKLANQVETMGVCTLSCELVDRLLDKVGDTIDLNLFFKAAKSAIDDNRTEMQKLEYLFADTVPENGMFYHTWSDKEVMNLLCKANVSYVDGRKCGADYDSVRLSLGQTTILTKRMVAHVLRTDGK